MSGRVAEPLPTELELIRTELRRARNIVRHYSAVPVKLPIDMSILNDLANRYWAKTCNKKIVMEKNDLSAYYIVDYISRFNPRYTCYVRSRFASFFPVMEKYAQCKNIFLTLTVDPKRCFSISHAKYQLSKSFSILTAKIRRYFTNLTRSLKRKKKLSNFCSFSSLSLPPVFIKTFEFQKNGMIHLHALLLNIAYLSAGYVLSIHDGRNKIEPIKYGLRAGLSYIYKYIIKNHRYGSKYDENSPIINDHTVLAWALGLRTFSISLSNRGISRTDSAEADRRLFEMGAKGRSPLPSQPKHVSCYHKMMVVGCFPSEVAGYFTRADIIPLLNEYYETGSLE